jgi:septum formation protein
MRSAGLAFEVIVSGADESVDPGTYDPRDPFGSGRALVKALALRKAASVAAGRPADMVLGADTLVVTEEGDLLGQPEDREEARSMIAILSGRTHFVHTGLALVCEGKSWEAVDTARVLFRPLTSAEIDEYVGTGEGDDKAGAYAYQGIGRALIERVDGNEETVIGLPLGVVAGLLATAAAVFGKNG